MIYTDAVHIKDFYHNVHLSAVYLFIQGIPILHTISHNYKFRTVEALISKKKAKKEDILKGITTVINMYKGRDLNVERLNADNEFSCITNDIRPTTSNIVIAEEHVGDDEHSIRTIKE